MRLLLFLSFLLLSTSAVAGEVKMSAKKNGTAKSYNVSQKANFERGDWQFETSNRLDYLEVDGEEKVNRSEGDWEVIYSFTERHYGILGYGYDVDNFREDVTRTYNTIGYGLKIYRSDTTKVSNEISVSDEVLRNSLWIRYKNPATKITFTNKYLVETGEHDITKNSFVASLPVSSNVTFSFNTTYINDDGDEEVIDYFALGYKF